MRIRIMGVGASIGGMIYRGDFLMSDEIVNLSFVS